MSAFSMCVNVLKHTQTYIFDFMKIGISFNSFHVTVPSYYSIKFYKYIIYKFIEMSRVLFKWMYNIPT